VEKVKAERKVIVTKDREEAKRIADNLSHKGYEVSRERVYLGYLIKGTLCTEQRVAKTG
jgi:uridine phosphorylase